MLDLPSVRDGDQVSAHVRLQMDPCREEMMNPFRMGTMRCGAAADGCCARRRLPELPSSGKGASDSKAALHLH